MVVEDGRWVQRERSEEKVEREKARGVRVESRVDSDVEGGDAGHATTGRRSSTRT